MARKLVRRRLNQARLANDARFDEGTAGLANRRQQTQAKAARERTVRERRERKQEKKRAAAAERKERAEGDPPAEREDLES